MINLLHNEFTNAIKTLKNNKTPGIYHIRNEDLGLLANERENLELLLGCNMALQIIFGMFNDSCKKGKGPKRCKCVGFKTFTKKKKTESEHDPGNYRPISLLNTFFGVYEAFIYSRLEDKLENLPIYQTAYRYTKSTSDNQMVLQELFFEYRFNKVYRAFLPCCCVTHPRQTCMKTW